jgi:hypothetical protein
MRIKNKGHAENKHMDPQAIVLDLLTAIPHEI